MAEMWRVVSQRQTEELLPGGGGFQTVYVVTFQVVSGPAAGSTGNVKIPIGQYNAATVGEQVEAAVSTLSEVAAL